ncbi:unnamed protein product, partial [Urochloa humidicola]
RKLPADKEVRSRGLCSTGGWATRGCPCARFLHGRLRLRLCRASSTGGGGWATRARPCARRLKARQRRGWLAEGRSGGGWLAEGRPGGG